MSKSHSNHGFRARALRPNRRRPFVEPLEDRAMLSLTITVNTTADTIDPTFNAISLREAIEISNGTLTYNPATDLNVPPLVSGAQSVPGPGSPPAPNTIRFNLPGSGIQTIEVVGSPLPAITEPVAIAGYSQPGSSMSPTSETEVVANNALVRIDGVTLGAPAGGGSYDGIEINAPDCTVSGLIVTGFSGVGLGIDNNPSLPFPAQGNWIFANFFGALPDPAAGRNFPIGPGSLVAGIRVTASNNRIGGDTVGMPNVVANNGVGIVIESTNGTGNLIQGNAVLNNAAQGILVESSNNTIGEALAGGGNVIGGNGLQGIEITGGPLDQGNNVYGNWVGTTLGTKDSTIQRGEIADPNGAEGVLILGSPKNNIGGSAVAARNVIGANALDGIAIEGATATGNRVLNNYIGFNQVGSLIFFLPNQNGVYLTAPGNFIGDGVSGDGNTISNNHDNGILLSGSGTTGDTIAGNVIGLNPDGGSAFSNAFDGIDIENAAGILIGGTTPGDRNTISSNNNGIVIDASTGTRVLGNFIGTGIDGVTALGNAVDGILIENAPLNSIGDVTSGAGNVISGNNYGIVITGATSQNNSVRGNFIGTDLTSTANIHNEVDGVLITAGASSNTIGGPVAGAGNAILNNVGAGVRLDDGVGNAVQGNSIFANTAGGIDLNASNNANNGQVAPVLTSVTPSDTVTIVQGTFQGLPNTSYTLEFFANASQDAPGVAQGQTWLGSYTVLTDTNGLFTIDQKLNTQVPAGQFITATATDPQGDTSTFSNALPAVPIAFQLSPATYTANETDGSVTITVQRVVGLAGSPGGAESVDYTVGGGTAVAGTDYTATSGTLFFLPTDPNTKSFTIPILNPGTVGGSVTTTITLSNPTNGATLGAASSATLTINDNALASIQVGSATASVNENAGTIAIAVSRNSNLGTTTVDYATSNGTAIAGTNYTTTSGTITFNPGETTTTINVPILDDNVVTGPLTFTFALSNPSNGVLGATASTVVTVVNTDAFGTVQFGTQGVAAVPGATSVSLPVTRINGQSGTITVHYATEAGTARAGVDFTPVSGTLTFAPGQVSKSITIPVANTSASGVLVSFSIALSAPTGGATLGGVASAIVNIPHVRGGGGGGPVTPPPTDTTPPTITGILPAIGPQGIYAIIISFSKPMNPVSASNLDNFGDFLRTPGANGQFNTWDVGSIAITNAVYDATTSRTVLLLAAPLPPGEFARLSINTSAGLAPGRGLTDLSGNLLDGTGTGAAPGSPDVVLLGEGRSLTYQDALGETVNLKISGPGLMSVIRAANGETEQVRLYGAVPRATTLSGSVRSPIRRFRPMTLIPSIVGANGARIKLAPPMFRLGGVSATAVVSPAAPRKLKARR